MLDDEPPAALVPELVEPVEPVAVEPAPVEPIPVEPAPVELVEPMPAPLPEPPLPSSVPRISTWLFAYCRSSV